ncbi:carbohydrate ABC transporter permease [Phytoactinopolyspora halotolerans]|uniref:Carbohydrate ABC transporter permease n=2 Tax=Phytoactinopolyspora halotolerans TaxID=1981512 RepID=A0A6L9S9V8_9ACTN|nr:carbohydrate ABC transporter permease [Phytoactinopolyspora halotolerans]
MDTPRGQGARPANPRTRPARDGSTMQRVLLYVALAFAALLFVGPLYWLFSSALKEPGEIYSFPPDWIPSSAHWENFSGAWNAAPFGDFFINSMIVTAGGAAIKLVNATLTAYAFVFLRFPFKNVIFLVMLGALMVPNNVTLIVNYITVSNLGWVNTYLGLIIPSAGSIFGMFLLRQYMMTLPREIVEAARVDGAGHMRTMWQVILPMCKPMLVTVGIIAVVDMWNDFIWPLIVTNTVEMRTLPIGLLYLRTTDGYENWGGIMAGTVMVALPMLILFLFAQRQIARGLTGGAVKG